MADEVDEEYGGRPRVAEAGGGRTKCLAIFFGVGILLMVIILPMSFVGVEYYQVRFNLICLKLCCIMIANEEARS